MEDKEIIRLLEKIIDDNILQDYLLDGANMCLETLKNNDENDKVNKNNKNNARNTAKRLFEIAGFKIQNSTTKSTIPTEEEQAVARAKVIVEEIKYYLDTRDLNPNLVACLEITINNLTKEGATTQELSNAINIYDNKLKPAITIADEYIHESSNHRK